MTLSDGRVRSHRGPSSRPRFFPTALLVGVVLAAGAAISARVPDDDAMQKPFVRTGVVGAPVSARAFDVTVLGVRGATVIDAGGSPHDTGGVWVIVRVRLTARGEPATVGYAAVADRTGRTYRASGRFDQFLIGGRTLQPGVPVVGEIAFEVPPSAAPGLSLRLADNPFDQRMDAMTDIALPITASSVSAWRADAGPAVLAPGRAG